ncbi:hypothetical protein IR083_10070 [Dysgonomonas sp. GY75]|uniref:hypothetical protein n=1 Tax=Dysgonomonas sp. GY75 TaxID=2780419 RepID=UPI0018846C02|nr:hypothetical protein [Dysgonomonas sp. GY75]MBF0649166.1 hypothetical protein [Dysgonomonas sp. GY75]
MNNQNNLNLLYIKLLNDFHRSIKYSGFTKNEIVLYYSILATFNESGWPENINRSNLHIQSESGLSYNAMNEARRSLMERGMLYFEPQQNGKDAIYGLTGDKKSNFDLLYLKLLEDFWHQTHINMSFRVEELCLYTFLLKEFNRENWNDQITVSNDEIQDFLHMSYDTLKKARNGLKKRGMIDFWSHPENNDVILYSLQPLLEKNNTDQ